MFGTTREHWSIRSRVAFSGILFIVLSAVLTWSYKDTVLLHFIKGCMQVTDRRAEQQTCSRIVLNVAIRTIDAGVIMNGLSNMGREMCHTPGHALGQELTKRRGLDAALAQCEPLCAGACIHGSVEQAFIEVVGETVTLNELQHPNETVLRDFGQQLCSRSVAACHGVGHALFQLFGDFDVSLAQCDILAAGERHRLSCHHAVFMESYLSSAHYVHPGAEEDEIMEALLGPCTSVNSVYRASCFRFLYISQEQIFRSMGVSNPLQKREMQLTACNRLGEHRLQLACIEDVAYGLGLAIDCELFADKDAEATCIFGAAIASMAFDEHENVLQYCKKQKEPLMKRACYDGYFTPINNRGIVPAETMCTGSSDAACQENLERFLKDTARTVSVELTAMSQP